MGFSVHGCLGVHATLRKIWRRSKIGMVGLQEMLMAADPFGDGKIFLLPAWPKNWDVEFRLHAPQQTVVDVSVKDGKVVWLKVTPESRKKDIVVNENFK